jgi:hypothetical protein
VPEQDQVTHRTGVRPSIAFLVRIYLQRFALNNHRQEFFDQIEVCKKNVIFFIKSNSIKKLKTKIKNSSINKTFPFIFLFLKYLLYRDVSKKAAFTNLK